MSNQFDRLVQMVEEAQELTARLTRLSNALSNIGMPEDAREDLVSQGRYMKGYLQVLTVRIAKLSNRIAGLPEAEEMPK